MPAGVVFAMAGDADATGALVECRDLGDRLAHLAFGADDADQALHRLLQVGLHGVGVLCRPAALERRGPPLLQGSIHRRRIHGRLRILPGVLRRVLAGALAEHDQVRQRVAAETVGAVDAGGALTGGEEAGYQRGLLGIGVHPDTTHDVVGRRADFHRLLGDVEIGQFLELVVHARQLAPRMCASPPGSFSLIHADVEEHAAVRQSAACLDLADDAAGDVIAGQQLGRAPGALVALRVAPALLGIRRRLRLVVVRDVVEHESTALGVLQHAALAAFARPR